MAINMYVKGFKSEQDMCVARDEFHEALVGSPAYINSEIALCDVNENGEASFVLCIGENNDNNVSFEVDYNNLKRKDDNPVESNEESSYSEEDGNYDNEE